MKADHLLHFQPDQEGFGSWRLSCIPGSRFRHISYEEATWPDGRGCLCTDDECPCNKPDEYDDRDHCACTHFGGYYIDEIGYACQIVEDPSGCCAVEYFSEVGEETIDGSDWPEDGAPWPVYCRWEDTSMVVRYADGEPPA